VANYLMYVIFFFIRRAPTPTLFPYTTLFRSVLMREPADHLKMLLQPFERLHRLVELKILRREPVVLLHPVRNRQKRHAQRRAARSEEHTSELQSRENLVCRLLLEKKNKKQSN